MNLLFDLLNDHLVQLRDTVPQLIIVLCLLCLLRLHVILKTIFDILDAFLLSLLPILQLLLLFLLALFQFLSKRFELCNLVSTHLRRSWLSRLTVFLPIISLNSSQGIVSVLFSLFRCLLDLLQLSKEFLQFIVHLDNGIG